MPAPLNTLPFQYRTRAPMVERMRNDTMRSQLAEDHDRELEDYLGSLMPTPWVAPTLLNGWVNYGNPWQNVQYRRIGDIVTIRGLATAGTVTSGTIIFNLPVGFRPPAWHIEVAEGGSIFGRFDVRSDGAVVWQIGAGTGAYYSLNAQFSVTP